MTTQTNYDFTGLRYVMWLELEKSGFTHEEAKKLTEEKLEVFSKKLEANLKKEDLVKLLNELRE